MTRKFVESMVHKKMVGTTNVCMSNSLTVWNTGIIIRSWLYTTLKANNYYSWNYSSTSNNHNYLRDQGSCILSKGIMSSITILNYFRPIPCLSYQKLNTRPHFKTLWNSNYKADFTNLCQFAEVNEYKINWGTYLNDRGASFE